MTPPDREDEAARVAAEVTRRAIRRLDILEWVLFVGAITMAVLGGGMVAWLVHPPTSPHFRTTWIVASALLFIVPGAYAIVQTRRAERPATLDAMERGSDEDG